MADSADENWLPILGFEGFYEVSDRGRARSLDRIIVDQGSLRRRHRKGRILVLGGNKGGYWHFLVVKDGVRKQCEIHQTVMQAFIGPQEDGIEVCHKNGDKADNRLDNLYYGTRQDNVRDSVRLDEYHRGEKCSWAKLTAEQVRAICSHPGSLGMIAKEFNASVATISLIKTRKSWTHITRDAPIQWKSIHYGNRRSPQEWDNIFNSGKTTSEICKETKLAFRAVWQARKRFKIRNGIV